MEEILAAAHAVDWRALGDRPLCDSCLGRLFGKLEHGFANQERGRAVREIAELPEGPCWVCGGLTSRYDDLAALVARKLAPWEFETFRIGSKIDPEVAGDVEMLQDMVVAACNEAVKKVDDETKQKMSGMLGGLGLPPGMF